MIKNRIPKINEISTLIDALVPDLSQPQWHYVAYPVVAGVQPCLVETEAPGGQRRIWDMLTVLPKDCPTSIPFKHPNYGNFLALIGHTLSKEIEVLKNRPDYKEAAEAECDSPPFRSKPLQDLMEGVAKFLAPVGTPPRANLAGITELRKALTKAGEQWVIARECFGHVKQTQAKNWELIEQWPEWENRSLSRLDRLLEYIEAFGEIAPSDRESFLRKLESFKQAYLRLGLICGVKMSRRELQKELAKRGLT